MSEAILGLVVLALIGLLAWEKNETKKERQKYINALVSRNASEMQNLEFIDKAEFPKPEAVKQDLIPAEEMTQDEFDAHIEEQLEDQKNA